jgi:hypothetical protein
MRLDVPAAMLTSRDGLPHKVVIFYLGYGGGMLLADAAACFRCAGVPRALQGRPVPLDRSGGRQSTASLAAKASASTSS